ncbi:butyryl-CoA dehydrogenase [Dethiosulfatibacter aminovorans DSM 17477]|uniref:Butyryl-CoA dehydrogenase n=1 Tax=Dethiosulfatibacter aminovorans DSM 17477 TaxID=1121476 RepID=A0A1M6JM78_9FIRM|nr:acyl-CoA dehydrogenase family protein [Dethiosulfatibacter aminovorans]SHJ47819.1 butyryl-CoA dehydrogenase [Dethiosulfatibacter aminovorans DSM 17477]
MFEFYNDDQKMIRTVVRELVKKEIAPHAAEWDEEDRCPKELVKVFGELGFLGVFVSPEYGGAGLGITERAIILEEVARHSAGFAMTLMTHDLCTAAIYNFGTEEQKKEWLPKLCSGEIIGGLSVTEPTGGSDLMNHATTIEKTDDGFVLNGRKVFITNSHIANLNIWTGKIGVNEKGRNILSAILIPPGTEGYSAGRKEHKLGLRGSVTGDTIAKDVKLGPDAIIGKEGKGAGVALHTIGNFGRSGMSAIALGVIKGSLEEAIKFGKERIIYGKPLVKIPAIQEMIAENQIEYEAASAMLYNATTVYDRGEDAVARLAAVKYFATEAAIRSSRRTMDLMGGYGVINEYPVGRFLRDAVTNIPSGGTSQIMKIIVAGNALK